MKKDTIRVIVVDDHQVVRDGILSMISAGKDISVIGQASCGEELFSLLSLEIPDILILDLELPDISGLDICSRISSNFPSVRVLVLSMYTGEEFIKKAVSEGARGYLPKNTSREELLEAIRVIASGKEYFNPLITEIILKSYISQSREKNKEKVALEELSKREIEVLKMLAEGIPNFEIAERLFISLRTVESHKSHIMQKLGFRTTAELVRFAIRQKLIEI